MQRRLTALLMALFMMVISAAPAVSAAAVSPTDISSSSDVASDSSVSGGDVSDSDYVYIHKRGDTQEPMRDISADELLSEINVGWNLGEALDSWSSDAGYDSFYNANAYQMIIRYDDAANYRSTSIATTFDKNNKASFTWQTGLIESDPQEDLGDIGFEIWNFAVEEATTVTVNCTKAQIKRRNNEIIELDELLGEHDVTISKYGTGACLTTKFSSSVEHTKGITDGTCTIEVELVDFPQKTYGKEQFFETLWNNPITTKEMIHAVKEKGFNAVRIPVTYFNHTKKKTYEIDEGWLNRVQEVVDYVLDEDMYCIIDMHNDGSTSGWLRVNTSSTDTEEVSGSDGIRNRFATEWQQIAERFKHYDEKLLFQGFNEITDTSSNWDYPGEDKIEWVNSLNQLFVDTVRATGSNNAERCLVVMPYSGSYDSNITKGFRLPTDTADNKLIASVNCYFPADFSWELESADDTSYTDVIEWGSQEDIDKLNAVFSDIRTNYIDNGIPLMITEFGTADKGNEESRINHAQYYLSAARDIGVPCFWWDDGYLLLRKSLEWNTDALADALIDSTSIHVGKLDIDITGDCWYTGSPVTPDITVSLKGYALGGSDKAVSGTDSEGNPITVPQSVTERVERYGLPQYSESVKEVATLLGGEDYIVTYDNNVELGTATMTISGMGKISGVRTIEFEIKEEPSAIANLFSFGSDDPDVPLVVMLTIPLLFGLGGLAIYQTIKRHERDRVEKVIADSLREDGENEFYAMYNDHEAQKKGRSGASDDFD